MLGLFAAAAAAPIDDVVNGLAYYYNVSVSGAFTLSDGTTHAAAAGPADRSTGKKATTASQYPGGSTTKTFTTVAALRLSEQGKLKLDDPIHTLVDPWLKTQGHSSLRVLWGGDRTIETVTARQLLGMRGGIADYDDATLRQWTVDHPTKDYLPIDYVDSVSKKFLFEPGHGGAYSGVSYVLMGWVLCAATNCADWTKLEQQALIETESFKLEQSRFMTTGPCSQYGVVHQYLYGTYRRTLQQRNPLAPPALSPEAAAASHCTEHDTTHGWYASTALRGTVSSQKQVSSGGAAACCGLGDQTARTSFWSFVAKDGSTERGTCYFYSAVTGGSHQANATSGRADAPLAAADFSDLFGDSCLNGWTMGNIATTPSDLSRFYHALFAEQQIISADSVAAMQDWKALTNGFNVGAPYGLGLFDQSLKIPLKTRSCTGFESVCKCSLFTGCMLSAKMIGHPGLDYGSGFPLIGFIKDINVSYALGANSGESPMGMNYSMGTLQNSALMSSAYCPFLQAAVQAQLPGFPDFECSSHRDSLLAAAPHVAPAPREAAAALLEAAGGKAAAVELLERVAAEKAAAAVAVESA